jgi:D-aspartate ligase
MSESPAFLPLLFGGDINVYSMARAFHEAYGVRPAVVAKYNSGPCSSSRILDLIVAGPDSDTPDSFVKSVCSFAEAHKDQKILLLGCGDSYVKLAAAHRDQYPENVVVPYISAELMDTLMHKERFYELCDKFAINHPKTFVHRKEMGHDFDLPFKEPFVCKPSNGVAYWQHPFPIQDKVFIAKNRAELEDFLDRVYASGYPDSMIIQDFVPGDDTSMRVMTCYSDQHGRVKLMCLGHVLLEEHSPHGIGNHAVILNEVNRSLSEQLREFLEAIGYVGFSNFDIKLDPRDGAFKVFEINVRQGRSNYYVTGAGYNLAEYVTEDWVFGKALPFLISNQDLFWHVVPMSVVRKYIPSREYQEKIRALKETGQCVNPMYYAPDLGLRRRLRLLRLMQQYVKQYRQYMPRLKY